MATNNQRPKIPMKLYQKQLHSLEELRTEKRRLRKELLDSNKLDLNPLADFGKNSLGSIGKDNSLSWILKLLGANSELDILLHLGKPLLNLLTKKKNSPEIPKPLTSRPTSATSYPKSSILKRLGKEILLGYLTGKALQLTVKGARNLIKRRIKR